MKHSHIKVLVLHLDNDRAGLETSEKIKYHLADRYEILDCRPKNCKDINDVLARKVLSHQIVTR